MHVEGSSIYLSMHVVHLCTCFESIIAWDEAGGGGGSEGYSNCESPVLTSGNCVIKTLC